MVSGGKRAACRGENTSIWSEVALLGRYVPRHCLALLIVVPLGLAAAFGEAAGIGLAVLFLFSILGGTSAMAGVGPPLSTLSHWLEAHIGDQYLAGVLLLVILCNAALVYLSDVTSASIANHIAQRVRDLIHRNYVTVGYRWMQGQEQGALLNTLATETWVTAEVFSSIAAMAVNLCAVLVFSIGLLSLSWQVTVTAVVASVATFALMRLLARPLRRVGEDLLASNQVLAERMLVSLQGMRTLRAFAQEPYVLRVFGASSSRVRRLANRAERLKTLVKPLGEASSLAALVLIAGTASLSGVEVPTIVASALLLFRMQPNLRSLDANRLALDKATAAIRNVRLMVQQEDKTWPTLGAHPMETFAEEIRFEAVTFGHDARRAPALKTISFAIRKGQVTALAGPSGSGKTTIINLLLRLYEPQSGRITVDGRDLLEIEKASWLSQIAIAGQDVELIEGSVAQNIRLARHDATLEDLREACAMAEVLQDIEALPDGFDSPIEAGGRGFSGGQRQRIGLARALVRRPEILILDEALNAVEPELEARIRARVLEAMRGKTLITVSHRHDAVRFADTIIQLPAGTTSDCGRVELHGA